LAALIGGCASNLVILKDELRRLANGRRRDAEEIDEALHRRLGYMAESPFISMFRGFVVYLAFMAGFLIFVEDPFKDATPSVYLRYVGTVSLIAFTMGYDPTRFADLINRIPVLGSPVSGKRDLQAVLKQDVSTTVMRQEKHTGLTIGPSKAKKKRGSGLSKSKKS
jgi:hypothetical protein